MSAAERQKSARQDTRATCEARFGKCTFYANPPTPHVTGLSLVDTRIRERPDMHTRPHQPTCLLAPTCTSCCNPCALPYTVTPPPAPFLPPPHAPRPMPMCRLLRHSSERLPGAVSMLRLQNECIGGSALAALVLLWPGSPAAHTAWVRLTGVWQRSAGSQTLLGCHTCIQHSSSNTV